MVKDLESESEASKKALSPFETSTRFRRTSQLERLWGLGEWWAQPPQSRERRPIPAAGVMAQYPCCGPQRRAFKLGAKSSTQFQDLLLAGRGRRGGRRRGRRQLAAFAKCLHVGETANKAGLAPLDL